MSADAPYVIERSGGLYWKQVGTETGGGEWVRDLHEATHFPAAIDTVATLRLMRQAEPSAKVIDPTEETT